MGVGRQAGRQAGIYFRKRLKSAYRIGKYIIRYINSSLG